MEFYLKKSVVAVSMFMACVGLVGCSDDKDEPGVDEPQNSEVVKPGNVFPGKMPSNVGGTSIARDAKGLVTEMKTSDGKTITFTYPSSRASEADYQVIMTIYDGSDKTVYNMTIGTNGFVSKSYLKIGNPGDSEYEEGNWTFSYDAEGHLVKGQHKYIDYYGDEDYTINIQWNNGNIVKTWKDEGWDAYVYGYTSASYPTAIENKGALFMFESIYPVEVYEFEWVYYAGMLGKGPKNLAVSSENLEEDSDGETTEYIWTLDANGYPTMFDVKDDDHPGTSTVKFIWN